MKFNKFIAAAMAAAMVLATACSGGGGAAPAGETPAATTPATTAPAGETPAANAEPKIFRVGLHGMGGKFNPIMTDTLYDDWVVQMIFDPLVASDAEGEYHDGPLSTFEISDDHLTYTFTLRDGITFSDGTPMTSADVEFTYKTMAIPEYDGPRGYAVDTLLGYEEFHAGTTDVFEGIKVIDEKTISFTFPAGSESPANIECFIYYIMPKHYYEFNTWDEFLAKMETPMGSGPMLFEEYSPQQYLSLVKNENYWDKANMPKIDGVLMNEIPDESIIGALQTNQIDFAQVAASQDNFDAVSALDGITTKNFIGNGYTYMCFNTLHSQLEDVKVRQALMYALDRKSFIAVQYGADLASVGMAPVSPASWAFPDAADMNAYDFDMAKAGALMDEAGWVMGSDGFRYKDGQKFSITWLVYTDSAWPGTLAGMAADTWKQLGVELNIELTDFVTVVDRTMDAEPTERDFDIYTMGFSLSNDPDPTGALFDADAGERGGFNASGYRNDYSQELIKKGKQEFDTDKRAVIYKEWASLMNQEIPTIIVAYRKEIWSWSNRITGLTIDTFQEWPLNSIKDLDIVQ